APVWDDGSCELNEGLTARLFFGFVQRCSHRRHRNHWRGPGRSVCSTPSPPHLSHRGDCDGRRADDVFRPLLLLTRAAYHVTLRTGMMTTATTTRRGSDPSTRARRHAFDNRRHAFSLIRTS